MNSATSAAATTGGAHPILLASEQRAVVQGRDAVSLVTGGPGTGKTTVAVETVVARVATGEISPDHLVVLAPTRTGAARLRGDIVARIGGTTTAPPARTPSSLAFSILQAAAAQGGIEVPMPRLLSGAEQDLILADLLRGHREGDHGPTWPRGLQQALPTRGFRNQLRDLLMRAVEHGLDPPGLAELGRRHARPEWIAAAEVLAEYDQVTALGSPGAFDPAWIGTAAAQAVREDPDGLGDQVGRTLRLIVVDDAQELTASAAELIVTIASAAPGVQVLLIGDPDATVQGFRGAEPGRMVAVAERIAAFRHRPGARPGESARSPSFARYQLSQGHRLGAELTGVASRLADRIGVSAGLGARHRHPAPAAATSMTQSVQASRSTSGPRGDEPAPPVRVLTPRSDAQQVALVADVLRRAHLLDGVPWSQMAVIARTRSLHEGLRRAMSRAGVPMVLPGGGLNLADQPAVRMILLAYEICLRPDPVPSAQEAIELLTSPLGGADPGALRRLRHLAAAHEPTGGVDEVIAGLLAARQGPEVLSWPGGDRPDTSGLRALHAVATVLAAGRAAAAGSPGELLWALWSASGLAASWEATALRPGPGGDRANRDLDALVTLFGAAEQFTDRLGRMPAVAFLDHVRAQEVAADSLVDRARPDEAVEVLTPQTAAGRSWRRVVVAGVQEGVWPDLRVRDTLLGAQALADLLTGRDPATMTPAGSREAVRIDELRQFHVAITRASEQVTVLAVDSADERPSSFVEYLGVPVETDPAPPDALTLGEVIAQLRRDLVLAERAGDAAARDRAVAGLAWAADHGLDGADPQGWWVPSPSSTTDTDRPLMTPGQVVLSPSQLQTFSECPLRWLLSSRGGQDPAEATAAAIGTLIHDLVAADPDADLRTLQDRLEARWSSLGLGEGWIVERHLAQAKQMLQRYTRYVQESRAQGFTSVEVERGFQTQIGPAQVRARIDRIETSDDGTVRVVDLKTGVTVPSRSDVEVNPQLGVYQEVLEPDQRATAGAMLVYLAAGSTTPTSREQTPVHQAEDPEWVRKLIDAAAVGMTGSTFPARPGDWCRTCQVRSSCPAQADGEVIG